MVYFSLIQNDNMDAGLMLSTEVGTQYENL